MLKVNIEGDYLSIGIQNYSMKGKTMKKYILVLLMLVNPLMGQEKETI